MNNTKKLVFESMADDMFGVKELLHVLLQDSRENEIDTHDFIRAYTHHTQREYVQWLAVRTMESVSGDPFRRVHAHVAEFLAANQEELDIQQNGKRRSVNIFGGKTPAERWIKRQK